MRKDEEKGKEEGNANEKEAGSRDEGICKGGRKDVKEERGKIR